VKETPIVVYGIIYFPGKKKHGDPCTRIDALTFNVHLDLRPRVISARRRGEEREGKEKEGKEG